MAAKIANFIPFDGIHCDHAKSQSLIFSQRLKLIGDVIPDEIKHPRLVEILGK